jgi:type IV pilus assembly PilX-like protein
MRTNNDKALKGSQSGASLVIVMVMVTVLMLLGISGYVASTTQFRVAANLQFNNVALGNAESALAIAEGWIAANYNNAGFAARTPGGLYPIGTGPDPLTMTWDDTTSVKADVLGAQRFMIEVIVADRVLPANSIGNCNVYGMSGPCPRVNVYRLTARGTSILGTTKLVQSIFTVRINV